MLGIDNRTVYPTALVPCWDVDGREAVLAVVKSTYKIADGQLHLSHEQIAVRHADLYRGTPGLSSVQYESDLALSKPEADVIINGTAYAPAGRAVTHVGVAAQVGNAFKELSVTGDRRWSRGPAGFYATQPVPFTEMPLVYERAFGGGGVSGGPAPQAVFHPNPVGCGFHVSRDTVVGSALPNIETPGQRISTWDARPAPGGFGFVDRYWEARARYAGTYDAQWHTSRLPFLPLDFDVRFFQAASEAMTIPHPRGGERVVLQNLTCDGVLQFPLVVPPVVLLLRYAGRRDDVPVVADTIVIEPDEMRVIVTMRMLLNCDGNALSLREAIVSESSVRVRRAFLQGKRVIGTSAGVQ